jgi:hypothetical protein
MGVASLEIQKVEEGSGVGLLPEPEEGGAQISDLACSTWVAAFEADVSSDEDKETTSCRSLERGLLWVHRAFDRLILPATTVSLLDVVAYSCLFVLPIFVVNVLLPGAGARGV